MTKKTLGCVCAVMAALAVPSLAGAQPFAQPQQQATSRYSLDFTQRPLTLPARGLRLDGELLLRLIPGVPPLEDQVGAVVNLGGGYGLSDDFEIGGTIIPLQLSPNVRYLSPSVYGMVRLVRGPTELGARLAVAIPVREETPLVFDLSAPLLLRIPAGRIDTGVGFVFATKFDDAGLVTSLRLPLDYTAQLNANFGLGLRTALNLPFNNTREGFMPLSFFARYALQGANEMPVVDLEAGAGFTDLVHFSGEVINASSWFVGLSGRFYVFN